MGVLVAPEIRGLKSEDIEDCYHIAEENASFYDEYVELRLLPRYFITLQEFNDIIRKKQNTRVLVSLKDENETSHINGFVCYEFYPDGINILYLESVNEDIKIYKKLLKGIIDKAKENKDWKIFFAFPETKLNNIDI